ncbi:MAG: PQQ-binding-like beta-propeller repeat protein [Myxococcales bacterium]|nr:PQQ-binding-like beta-propeller repeat protein [Myxococcales bacterium]
MEPREELLALTDATFGVPTLPSESRRAILELLFGASREDVELPAMTDLTAAMTSLASGLRRKALLPVGRQPAEFALLRRGRQILISHYETGSAPEVHQLNRPVELGALLERCARATLEGARYESDPTSRQIAVRVAERALRAKIVEDPAASVRPVHRRGGAMKAPARGVKLAFGFTAEILPGAGTPTEASSRADVHALLFEGELWAFVRGRRVRLARGPIMLAVQRMVLAVEALVEAREASRELNVRLVVGGFRIELRLSGDQKVALGIGNESLGSLGAEGLEVAEVALPILRLASDLLRSLVAVDRGQSRNLRVSALREEVRALRRRVRERERADAFVNADPDQVRLAQPRRRTSALAEPIGEAPHSLRFGERWRVGLDGLDTASTFFCGDRLVVATNRHVVALDRDTGDVLWARDTGGASHLMAGEILVALSPEGDVELCDVRDGEPFARTRIMPRVNGPSCGLISGGDALPPVAVLAEGTHRLVAIDLRTAEPLWRFTSRGGNRFSLRRAGRILIVTSGDGAVHALDVISGEVLWRYRDRSRFVSGAAICGDVIVALSGQAGARAGIAHGIDLYSGAPLWKANLGAGPSASPIVAGESVIVASGTRSGVLRAFEARSGALRWGQVDPGLGRGGAGLVVDDILIVSAPDGTVSGIQLGSGELGWSSSLADPVADDVPRRLEPVLRGGALFVPSANVHVMRPSDGSELGPALPCDLVPDRIRVDERGWVYVAEESGYIAACAPVPHLRLIRGGGGG